MFFGVVVVGALAPRNGAYNEHWRGLRTDRPGCPLRTGALKSRARIRPSGGTAMSRESRMLAGLLFVVIPTVMFGGITILSLLVTRAEGYIDNPMRQDLWRAGHAHAGVYLVVSLVMLRYVDEAALSRTWKWVARLGAPIAAILI